MKVAFFVYPPAFQAPGGGEMLLLKTKEALEKKGIEVKLFNQWQDKLKDFDILHIFGSVKDCLGLIQIAKSLGVKIVLSPIFWSTLSRSLHEYGGPLKKTAMLLQHMTKVICPAMPSERRKMLLLADALVPNSEAEAEQVSRLFAVSRNKMQVVPLAADERFAMADKTEFVKKYNIDNFILSVGRIEPRKNQLNLIRALKGTGLQLVFIGDYVPDYKKYYEVCRDEADKNTKFLGHINHNDTLLASAYAACSIFVLQGWFETPGLAALEAGFAGARLAVTKDGSTREYFKDYAAYFHPGSPRNIREVVIKVLNNKKSDDCRRYIMKNFLWSNAADEYIKIYKRLLS